MNDRYLYRAKRADNVEWVEGHLITDEQNKDKYFIGYVFGTDDDGTPHDFDVVAVDPSTICQCTGLKDKNGKLIWENDVVKGKYYDNGKSHRHIGQVKYIYEAYKVVGVKQYTGYHAHLDGSYEVIGNIFDNKELLEREDKNENNY